MSIEATAEALAPDTAMPVDAPIETTTEISEDDAMGAVFDSLQETDPETTDQPTKEAQDVAETPDELEAQAEKPKVEAPSEVPYQVKQHWADIPEAARAAILESQREMGRKLGEQGRQIQGISPIRDVLVKATQELPGLSNMSPQDAATNIFEMAKISSDFNEKPVETMLGLIKRHNMGEAIGQALAGQPMTGHQTPQLMKQIEGLQREIKRLSDPNTLRESFTAFSTEAQVESSVTEFSQTAEHWGAVEAHMPAAVQYVKSTMPEGTSAKDILSKAYDLAVGQFVPDAKAKQEDAAGKAAPIVDPERSKSAIKAKSANVKSTSSGKTRTMTEDEILSATFDKLQN